MASPLLSEIVREIERRPGRAMPFHEYMEAALYHPVWGYYQNRKAKLGRGGDFFTSAHAGDAFGRVLARLFLRMTRLAGGPEGWTIVEMGAGDGRLAAQLAEGILECGPWPDGLTLHLVETSPFHRELQQKTVGGLPIRWRQTGSLAEVPRSPRSFVYSNELVDAFPVHRIKKEQGTLFESFVRAKASAPELEEIWIHRQPDELDEDLRRLASRMQDGQTAELQLAARDWMRETARWMEEGYLLTIDYGGRTDELLARRGGTLRGYAGHRIVGDVLGAPGEIDITCHVHFEFLEEWGRRAGLCTIALESQARFFVRAGTLELLPSNPSPDPFSPEARRTRSLVQLMHPEAMGEAFQVLLQSKGLPDPLMPFPNAEKSMERG